MRKSYADPYGENLFSWSIHGIKSVLVFFAIERYAFVTLILPLSAVIVNGGVALILIGRRYAFKKTMKP
jgi:hypothetical protein